MEAFQFIEGPQEFSKLLQTNKLYSVVGLGKACEVPVQSLWPAAVPKKYERISASMWSLLQFISIIQFPYDIIDTQTNFSSGMPRVAKTAQY